MFLYLVVLLKTPFIFIYGLIPSRFNRHVTSDLSWDLLGGLNPEVGNH